VNWASFVSLLFSLEREEQLPQPGGEADGGGELLERLREQQLDEEQAQRHQRRARVQLGADGGQEEGGEGEERVGHRRSVPREGALEETRRCVGAVEQRVWWRGGGARARAALAKPAAPWAVAEHERHAAEGVEGGER